MHLWIRDRNMPFDTWGSSTIEYNETWSDWNSIIPSICANVHPTNLESCTIKILHILESTLIGCKDF